MGHKTYTPIRIFPLTTEQFRTEHERIFKKKKASSKPKAKKLKAKKSKIVDVAPASVAGPSSGQDGCELPQNDGGGTNETPVLVVPGGVLH